MFKRKIFMEKTEIPERKVFMNSGATGSENLTLPSADRQKFRYITVDNGQSDNVLTISVDGSTSLLTVGKYCCRTIPIPPEITDSFIISWTDPAPAKKMARIYYSMENLNFNASFAGSFA